MLIERSDAELIDAVRRGDTVAFGELWQRHSGWARWAAGRMTRWREHDDIVAEAYTRILRLLRDGRGPVGPFRPYLYVIMRHLAMELESTRRTTPLIDGTATAVPVPGEDLLEDVWNRSHVVSAFRSLPEAWRTALWYTEVEGLSPRELGRHLGISANSAAALSYRAREGLRQAWLRTQVGDLPTSEQCRWVVGKLMAAVRGRPGDDDRKRLAAHVANCGRCRDVESVLDGRGSRLAPILVLPLLAVLTARAAGIFGGGSTAAVAAGSLTPPAVVAAAGTTGGAVVGGLAAAAAIVVVAGVQLAMNGGGAAAAFPEPPPPAVSTVPITSASPTGEPSESDDPGEGVGAEDAIGEAVEDSRLPAQVEIGMPAGPPVSSDNQLVLLPLFDSGILEEVADHVLEPVRGGDSSVGPVESVIEYSLDVVEVQIGIEPTSWVHLGEGARP